MVVPVLAGGGGTPQVPDELVDEELVLLVEPVFDEENIFLKGYFKSLKF